jgi:membrane-anchored protein YejM (alkaline phosphatase superfamily)
MSNTIIVVTSDHGEEFNDNGAGYWGHASNFTEYQTHVPMVIYVPGHAPRRVTALTTHVDIPTTLIQEVCRPEQDERMYSNGTNLFRALPRERPLVVSSYVNHAFILGDDVYSIFPMYVQQYKLDNVRAHADRPRPDESRAAMEEITRFRGGRSVVAEATARRDAAAAARRGAGTRLSSACP